MTPSATRPLAVVTGAARGIGAAVATALAAQGYDLVLGDVAGPDIVAGLRYPLASPEDLTTTAESCRGLGVTVDVAACDVRDADSVAALVDLSGDRPLHAAVAVAGLMAGEGPAWEQDDTAFSDDLGVNLFGVVNLARAVVPRLLAAADPKRGRFVCVVSSAGERGLPLLASYVASKHAALGYIRALAADLAPTGVTVNAVLPGSTDTVLLRRTADVYGLGSVDGFARHQRLGRLLDPAEIAAAVVYLCSETAGAVTGTALAVDGGFTG